MSNKKGYIKYHNCVKCGYDINHSNFDKHIKVCDGKGPHWKRERNSNRDTKNLDLTKVQEYYDNLHTVSETCMHFNISIAFFFGRARRGLLKTRTKMESTKLRGTGAGNVNRKHTTESKRKISLARKQFLDANPNKVPYLLNHSSKDSYPEKLFEQALKDLNITGWIKKYQVGRYEYDFAFLDKKIDVEIDGSTHLLEKVKLIDKARDVFSEENGWAVLRIAAKEVLKDVKNCITTHLMPLLKE